MTHTERSLSKAHRAILLIAKAHASKTIPNDLPALLSSAKPESLARIAQHNNVHTLAGEVFVREPGLRDAIPRDLFLYFKAMYTANQERSAKALSQLKQIDKALSQDNIPSIVMKGGGDLLDHLHQDQNIRFVGDLDLLVPHERLDAAQAQLFGIGAETVPFALSSSNPRVNQRGVAPPKHHLPKIIHSDWELPVELHFEVGRTPMDQILPAKDVLSRALATEHGQLMVMSPEDRACHLIAHANHHDGEADLRSWIDWTALRDRCDLAALRLRLKKHDLADVLSVFEDMAEFLKSPDDDALSKRSDGNTAAALMRFGDSRRRKLRYIPNLVMSKTKALLRSPEYRHHVSSRLLNRSWWRDTCINHWTKIKNQR